VGSTRPFTAVGGDRVEPGILRAMAIRVVLAEDHYLVREGVRRLLETQKDLDLVASCEDYDSLMKAVDEFSPDVVLTDIRMPPTSTDEGIQASERIRETHPETGVVVLSQFVEPEYALALLEKGASRRAYLLKERVSDVDQLLDAIREVARGGSVIDPKVVEVLVEAKSRAKESPLERLTPREREILSEMAQGKNNAAIAATLVLTERAVEKHINSIFSKLALGEEKDVHRRVKAVLLYLAHQG
jgi:DNA-binding NarL/FixJ family response regulator